jgi:membrane protease YdiL (CAAX protease family)
MLWLFAMVLVIGAGMLVSAAATAIAISTGLSPERAISLISDPGASPLVTSSTWITISILASQAALTFSMWGFLRRHRVFFRELCPLRAPSLRELAGALICCFGFSPLAGLMAELTRRALPRDVTAETMVASLARGVAPLELLSVLMAAALVPAVVEECLFRGFLTRPYLGRSNALALLVPSAMFGVFHLEPTQAVASFVLGLGFGIARLYTDSVLAAVICHLVYNAYVLVDVHAGGQLGDTELHFGRVGLGLALSAFGFALLVAHPGEAR